MTRHSEIYPLDAHRKPVATFYREIGNSPMSEAQSIAKIGLRAIGVLAGKLAYAIQESVVEYLCRRRMKRLLLLVKNTVPVSSPTNIAP